MIGVRENDVGLCSNTFEIFMHNAHNHRKWKKYRKKYELTWEYLIYS
jgi:hypothetical protein